MRHVNRLFMIVIVCCNFNPAKGVAMPMDRLLHEQSSDTERVRYLCSYYGWCYWLPRNYAPPYLGPGVYSGYYRHERGSWW